ncbi:MAG: HAD hydrolase-like protein [archaeon]|nr:MAG: HAD hydrolase-like protein [archaeon]
MVSRGVPAVTNGRGKVWALKDKRLPGTGVYVEKVENMSGRRVEVAGKPSDFSVGYVKSKFKLNPKETVFFGDSLNSDMKFARKLGWAFAFALTGEYGREDLEKVEKPDFVLENLREILK